MKWCSSLSAGGGEWQRRRGRRAPRGSGEAAEEERKRLAGAGQRQVGVTPRLTSRISGVGGLLAACMESQSSSTRQPSSSYQPGFGAAAG